MNKFRNKIFRDFEENLYRYLNISLSEFLQIFREHGEDPIARIDEVLKTGGAEELRLLMDVYVNGLSIGQVSTTSRLHAHSGDIGLGAMNDGSYFSNGKVSGDQYYFRGVIYEFLMYNSSHDQDDIEKVDRVLQAKWF